MFADRVLSGMRPTGRMHIGHYHGALKNWLRLQEEHECLYFAADWHALTTHYETPERIEDSVWEMFIDWLAVGINPNRATIFIQSRVIEHAELTLLLGMIAPVGWLERVPTYKDQQEKLSDRDLSTFGFLGYPVMQAADILIYRANMVPVGDDQVYTSSWYASSRVASITFMARKSVSRKKPKPRSRSSAPSAPSATIHCGLRSRSRAMTPRSKRRATCSTRRRILRSVIASACSDTSKARAG